MRRLFHVNMNLWRNGRAVDENLARRSHEEMVGLAAKAKAGCPVSKLLNAKITLDTKLVD